MATAQKQRQLKEKEPSSTMSEQLETTNPLDPFDTLNTMRDASLKTWQTMRDASLESWSRMMIDLVNSEAYSQATSQWLDTYLTVSQPFQTRRPFQSDEMKRICTHLEEARGRYPKPREFPSRMHHTGSRLVSHLSRDEPVTPTG